MLNLVCQLEQPARLESACESACKTESDRRRPNDGCDFRNLRAPESRPVPAFVMSD